MSTISIRCECRCCAGAHSSEKDDEKAPLVAIVNESMAQAFWPSEDPLGKRFSMKSATGPFIEIVGVAKDGKYLFMGFSHERYFYVPMAQHFTSYRTLQLRSSVPPESLITQVQNTVRSVDPNMPIMVVQTMNESLAGPQGSWMFRVGAMLALAMGILGLTLAVVGVYGVVSFAASQRTHEIGIRMALGAGRRDILRLVLGQGLMLVIAGVLSGMLVAWALTRSMATLLIGVSPTDALTFVTATLVLGGDRIVGVLRARAAGDAIGSDGGTALRVGPRYLHNSPPFNDGRVGHPLAFPDCCASR